MKKKIKPVSEMTDDELLELLDEGRQKMLAIKQEVRKVVFGKETERLIDTLIVALLARLHVMVRAEIGTAKTLTCNAFANTIDGVSHKIQLRPDMVPQDISGFRTINLKTGEAEYWEGPVVGANIFLADEINRTTAKTLSALLEVMEERQVTIGKKLYRMDEVFLVLATRNPREHEGVYELPEALLDRFGLQPTIENWSVETGMMIARNAKYHLDKSYRLEDVKKIISLDEIVRLRDAIFAKYHVEDRVSRYIVNICHKTQEHKYVAFGSSPRGIEVLQKVSQVAAFLEGREPVEKRVFVVGHEDVRKYAVDVLAHRIFLKDEVRYSSDVKTSPAAIIQEIVEDTPIGV